MVQRYKLYLRYPNIYGKYYRSLTFISIIIQKQRDIILKCASLLLIIKIISIYLPWFEVTVEILTRSCEVFSVWVFVFRLIQT